MTPPKRVCELPGCDFTIESHDARKRFCCKQHADRSRNLIYRVPFPPKYEHIADLRHFARLTPGGRRAVLLGETPFKVVSFDIEATHLKANVGRIICCSFKPLGKRAYTLHALQPQFMKADNYDDADLAAAIRDELERYDIIVSWNGKQFDTRFINARLLRADMHIKKGQPHVDGYWSWKSKAAAFASLKAVQQFVLPHSKGKTPIEWEEWMRVIGWDEKLRNRAMRKIVQHCVRDVEVLEDVYRLLAREDVIRTLRVDGGIL